MLSAAFPLLVATVRNATWGRRLVNPSEAIDDVSSKAVIWWNGWEDVPEIPTMLEAELSLRFQRLAQRASVMLLQALPEGVKQEMIATRHMDAANIPFKVIKTF